MSIKRTLWWLPGAMFALAGILFLATTLVGGSIWWVPLGIIFLIASALHINRSRPR